MGCVPHRALRCGRRGLCGAAIAITYSDAQIAALLNERKPLPRTWRVPPQLKRNRQQAERQFDLIGQESSSFVAILRQNLINPLDFSAILAVRVPGSNQLFRLRRYNGATHRHRNRIEGDAFATFHIHTATERYQEEGPHEDSFAEPTARYTNLTEALVCLVEDANFAPPDEYQAQLP